MEKTVLRRKVKEVENKKRESFSESTTKTPTFDDQHSFLFWFTVAFSQVVAFALLILAIFWGKKYGGFSVTDNDLLFNYHPLFMILGLIVFYGDAIIVYRVLSFLPKNFLKVVHASLHICAIVFSSLALVAVFENHRLTEKADFFSLHSWIGIATFGAFCLQYVGSFVAYLYPGLPPNWRSQLLPYHTFFGVGIFVMAVASAGMGITEKLLWTPNYASFTSIPEGLIGNSLGLLILVFAFLIVFIVTHASYKRKPLPSEVVRVN